MAFDLEASREHLATRLARQREQAEERRMAALAAARAAIGHVAPRYAAVRRVYLFGSLLVPGQFRSDSDIDVGIEGELDATAYFEVWRAIEDEAPGWQVDLVELDRARRQFAASVRLEGELVYEA